jgi:hypothetical protein
VDRSLNVAKEHDKEEARRTNKSDLWIDISLADYRCLMTRQPARVAAAYRQALTRATPFDKDAVRRQLCLYQTLGILLENVTAALALPELAEQVLPKPQEVVLFTGHQIDSPERTKSKPPRFPSDKELVARRRLKEEVARACQGRGGAPMLGIAGAASGGDILFHEVCAELNVPTHVYLALPDQMFINESVAPANADWVERFHKLLRSKDRTKEVRQLAESVDTPKWLQAERPNYGIWQRNNLWMLHNALALGGERTTLIALWDGQGGDGPGGTEDMVHQAQQMGAGTIIINTKQEFGL